MSRDHLSHSDSFGRFIRAGVWLFAAACTPAIAGLDVNPVFPAWGDSISLELNSVGAPPWLPGTRYRREGNTIVLEMEQMAGGFFGPRADMEYAPVPVGELAPGTYALQARLYDIGNPDAPPRLFSQTLDVAAPEATGVYTVPRVPGAYEAIEFVVRADAPIDAASLRASVEGWSVRIDFMFSSDPNAPSFATVKMPGLAPYGYRVDAYGAYPNMPGVPPRRYAGSFNVAATTTVVEYYAAELDHYFMTATPDEITRLDARVDFKRTGQKFKAWARASDAPASASPVCRFYASGPNSHFYTADPGECESLKALEQKDKAVWPKGEPYPAWQYEGIAFYAVAPREGKCDPGMTPVYRFYNNRWAESDSNHRFTVTPSMRLAMWMSWRDEGVAFCSPA